MRGRALGRVLWKALARAPGRATGAGGGPGAGEGGRVEVMIARALFKALTQLHDVPADLPEGAVEFVAAAGEGRDEDGIEN